MTELLPILEEFSDEELLGFDSIPDEIKNFVHFYLQCGRPLQAALQAGLPRKGIKARALAILRKPKIQRYVEYQRRILQERANISKDYIVKHLKDIVEKSNSTDTDKIRALRLLADIAGITSEKGGPATVILNYIQS